MDQDETWHWGRPRPGPHCVRWGPTPPSKSGAQAHAIFGPCLLWPNGCGLIKTPLGTKVGVGPGDIVLDVDPAPPPKKGAWPPIFGLCLLWPNARPSQLLLSTHLYSSRSSLLYYSTVSSTNWSFSSFNVSCELVNHQLIQNSAVVTVNGPILQISVHPPTLWKRPQSFDDIDIYLQHKTSSTKMCVKNLKSWIRRD